MGLGSILGTGIFVSIGVAAGVAGPSVVLAVALGAVVATFNGLSSAQLATAHPKSGGTYEYGYRYLNPLLGFTAGWMFLCAKSASAATAALGFGGYVLLELGVTGEGPRIAVGMGIVTVLTAVVAGGMRRSDRTNAIIVSVTLLALGAFVLAGAPAAFAGGRGRFTPLFPTDGGGLPSLLHGTALMFVAYTGYGRIATLGEEVRDPARSIPRAIVITLLVTMVLYMGDSLAPQELQPPGFSGRRDSHRAERMPLDLIPGGPKGVLPDTSGPYIPKASWAVSRKGSPGKEMLPSPSRWLTKVASRVSLLAWPAR